MPPPTLPALLLAVLTFVHSWSAFAGADKCLMSAEVRTYKLCLGQEGHWACPSKGFKFSAAERAEHFRTKTSCKDKVAGPFDPPGKDPKESCVNTLESCHQAHCGECGRLIEAAKAAEEQKKKAEEAERLAANPPVKGSKSPAKPEPPQYDPKTPRSPEVDGSTREKGGLATREALEKAAAEQRRAAELAAARRRELLQGNETARENKVSTITNAADILDNWKHHLDTNPGSPPESQQRYRSDLQLFHKARVAMESGNPSFSRSDAERAFDAGVRRELTEHAESQTIENWTAKEEKRVKVEEEKFRELAKVSGGRAVKMGAAYDEASFSAAKMPLQAAAAGPVTAYPVALQPGDKKSLGAEQAQSTISTSKGTELESGNAGTAGIKRGRLAGGGSAAHSAGAREAQGSDKQAKPGKQAHIPSLRELLRNRMNKSNGTDAGKEVSSVNKDALDGASFSEALSPSNLSGAGHESEAASKSLAEDMLQGINEGPRTLAQALDTEAASREIASALHGGLLGLDTQNLFERIMQAHRACQARDCVNSH